MQHESGQRFSPRVAVIGDGDAPVAIATLAEHVGAAIAREGAVLVCGGLGGVMEAACRGARTGGGSTIGLLPGVDLQAANAFVSLPIATGLGEARNLLVIRNAAAIVAVGGRFGTLSEIAFALKLRKPVIAVASWGLRPAATEQDPLIRVDDPAKAGELASILASADHSTAQLTYHLIPADNWNTSDAATPYLPADFSSDGFIHCTDGGDELAATGNRHLLADRRDFLALVIRRSRVSAPITYDAPGLPYPHIFGPLNRDAILAALPMPRANDGAFLPLRCGDYLMP